MRRKKLPEVLRWGGRIGWTGLVLLVVSSCATVDLVTGRKANNLFSLQDDIDLGREAFEDLKAEMEEERVPANRDRQTLRRLETMSSRIVQASGCATNFAFEVAFFETNIVNAFAFPGGKIAIFKGLWDNEEGLVKNDDELAAVLAHEVAHVTCRHSTEEMTRHLPAELLLTAAAIYAEFKEDEDWGVAIDAAFFVYGGLIVPKYSRHDEAEADRVGLMYMAKAGYDPRAALQIWKRAYEKEGDEWPVLSLFSTHPSNKDRYQAIERQMPKALALYEAHREPKPQPASGWTTAPEENPPASPALKKAGLFERSAGQEKAAD